MSNVLDEDKTLPTGVFSTFQKARQMAEAFNKLSKRADEASVAFDKFTETMEENLKSEFKVGQRIQFYRKGLSEDNKDITLAINGVVQKVCTKTGWLTVEHKWGIATVKPDDEKLQVLQQKASKQEAYSEVVDGHHRLAAGIGGVEVKV